MAVTMNIDFWQIRSEGNGPASVEATMRACFALPSNDERRLLHRETKTIRLQYLEKRGRIWQGDFVGIRTRAAAKRGDTTGHIETLEFQDNEGLCEETAFLVVPAMNLLVLQRNRMGATSASIALFLQRFNPQDKIVDLFPIPTEDTIDSLNRFTEVSKITIGIARLENARDLGRPNDSLSSLLNLGATIAAPNLSLQLSVGHQTRKVLSLARVSELMRHLLKLQDDNPEILIKKAIISGRNEDEERDILDLALSRLQAAVEVDADEGRGPSRATRLRALREEFEGKMVALRHYAVEET